MTEVLPLAITVMAGPQILSVIILVTGVRPVASSLAFIVAVAIAMGAMIALSSWASPDSSAISCNRTRAPRPRRR